MIYDRSRAILAFVLSIIFAIYYYLYIYHLKRFILDLEMDSALKLGISVLFYLPPLAVTHLVLWNRLVNRVEIYKNNVILTFLGGKELKIKDIKYMAFVPQGGLPALVIDYDGNRAKIHAIFTFNNYNELLRDLEKATKIKIER